MLEQREPLFDKKQTSNRIKALCRKYHLDLGRYRHYSPAQFFDLVRRIKYRRDRKPIEVIARPKHILKYSYLGMDCKKKAILLGSYFQANKIPYRFIGSSRRLDKKIHHIFPQAKILPNGMRVPQWVNWDATYNNYRPAMKKSVTSFEVL